MRLGYGLGFAIFFLISQSIVAANGGLDDYKDLRIEREEKMVVPAENAEQAWLFLVNELIISRKFLDEHGSHFNSYTEEEISSDRFYDTPALDFIRRGIVMRHRHHNIVSKPKYPRNGKQTLQLKISGLTDDILERGELTYKMPHAPAIPSDGSERWPAPIDVLELPLDEYRDKLKKDLTTLGIDHKNLSRSLITHGHRRRIYVEEKGKDYSYITIDQIRVDPESKEPLFTEFEVELNIDLFAAASVAKRKAMRQFIDDLVKKVQAKFPGIQRDLTPKYAKAYALSH